MGKLGNIIYKNTNLTKEHRRIVEEQVKALMLDIVDSSQDLMWKDCDGYGSVKYYANLDELRKKVQES